MILQHETGLSVQHLASPSDDPAARDHGAATIWTAGAVAALLGITTLVVWLGSAAATRHRAESAADLAALAAAAFAVEGVQVACGKAGWVADRMRVELRACRLDGWNAQVEITAAPPGVLAGFGPAEARARAGPVADQADGRRTVVRAR